MVPKEPKKASGVVSKYLLDESLRDALEQKIIGVRALHIGDCVSGHVFERSELRLVVRGSRRRRR